MYTFTHTWSNRRIVDTSKSIHKSDVSRYCTVVHNTTQCIGCITTTQLVPQSGDSQTQLYALNHRVRSDFRIVLSTVRDYCIHLTQVTAHTSQDTAMRRGVGSWPTHHHALSHMHPNKSKSIKSKNEWITHYTTVIIMFNPFVNRSRTSGSWSTAVGTRTASILLFTFYLFSSRPHGVAY